MKQGSLDTLVFTLTWECLIGGGEVGKVRRGLDRGRVLLRRWDTGGGG